MAAAVPTALQKKALSAIDIALGLPFAPPLWPLFLNSIAAATAFSRRANLAVFWIHEVNEL
ncbi:MAG: hypothetical protein ACREDJ_10160 [Methylocella sp.]